MYHECSCDLDLNKLIESTAASSSYDATDNASLSYGQKVTQEGSVVSLTSQIELEEGDARLELAWKTKQLKSHHSVASLLEINVKLS